MTYHTPDLMERIHPDLRGKYERLLKVWRWEVRRWKMTPNRISTAEHDVAPAEKTGPFTDEEDDIMRELFPILETKVLARAMNRIAAAVSGRAYKLGLVKKYTA